MKDIDHIKQIFVQAIYHLNQIVESIRTDLECTNAKQEAQLLDISNQIYKISVLLNVQESNSFQIHTSYCEPTIEIDTPCITSSSYCKTIDDSKSKNVHGEEKSSNNISSSTNAAEFYALPITQTIQNKVTDDFIQIDTAGINSDILYHEESSYNSIAVTMDVISSLTNAWISPSLTKEILDTTSDTIETYDQDVGVIDLMDELFYLQSEYRILKQRFESKEVELNQVIEVNNIREQQLIEEHKHVLQELIDTKLSYAFLKTDTETLQQKIRLLQKEIVVMYENSQQRQHDSSSHQGLKRGKSMFSFDIQSKSFRAMFGESNQSEKYL